MSGRTGDRPPALPALAREAHKGSVGRVLCFAGGATMPGAAILVVRAAQRAGAGLVTLAVFDRGVLACVAPASPETIYLDLTDSRDLVAGRLPRPVDRHPHEARVIGPAIGRTGRARQLVLRLLDGPLPVPSVLDADALSLIAPLGAVDGPLPQGAASGAPLVLTPHPGEAARLLGRDVGPAEDERRTAAQEIARRAGGLCVLKGAGTVVTDGERSWVNPSGNPGMATAGSGDVLAGILGAYLAAWWVGPRRSGDAELDAFDVVRRAVYDHGRAGDRAAEARGARHVIASDLVDALAAAAEDD